MGHKTVDKSLPVSYNDLLLLYRLLRDYRKKCLRRLEKNKQLGREFVAQPGQRDMEQEKVRWSRVLIERITGVLGEDPDVALKRRHDNRKPSED